MMEVRTAVKCSLRKAHSVFSPLLKYLIITPQEVNVGGSGLGAVSQPGTDGHCDVRRVKREMKSSQADLP